MSKGRARFVSAQADLRDAQVKAGVPSAGRSQNGTRQAIRGIKDMFKKDGLL